MQTIETNKLATYLSEGYTILVSAEDGSALIGDANNDDLCREISSLITNSNKGAMRILIDSDARLNRHVNEVPALAWDIIDTAEQMVILILNGGQNVSKYILSDNDSIAIQTAKDPLLKKLVQSAKCPLLLVEIESEDLPESFASIDYMINLPAPLLKSTASKNIPIIFLGSDNEVRVIRE